MNKPKLELKRRTIARLNNVEMRHVLGGDGDEGTIGLSRDTCGSLDELNIKSDIEKKVVKFVLSQLGLCIGGK